MSYEYGCCCDWCGRELEPDEHIVNVGDQLFHEGCFEEAASEIMLDLGYATRTTYSVGDYDNDYWDDIDFRIKDAKEESFLRGYMS